MSFVPLSNVLLGGLFLFFLQGCCSKSHTRGSQDYDVNISCLIINLEYVDCNWTKPQMQEINYTFSSLFLTDNSYQECQEYLQENGQNVGCRIPLQNQEQRFDPFYTKLSSGRNQSHFTNYTSLKERVKLNPPYNVSLSETGVSGEICLHWVNSGTALCVDNMVHYQRGSEEWKISKDSLSPYCISAVSDGVTYTFQVRSTIAIYCGSSKFWSDWSKPVHWSNGTVTERGQQPQVWWHLIYIAAALLLFLSALLCYNDRIKSRIKIILIPAVPDPSKHLQDLFQKYNCNVESWVHISKELKEAFELDYTESYCVVYEPSPAVESKSADGPTEQS